MEEIIDESFFLTELMDKTDEPEVEEEKNFIQSNFAFRQIGSITKYVEPVSASNTLEFVLEKFLDDEDLIAIPIEEESQVIGLIERRSVEKLLKKKFSFLSNKKIIDYIQTIPITVFARDYIEKTLSKISKVAYKNDIRYFPVMYDNNSFYGIVSLEDFLTRVSEVSDKDLEKAKNIQQYMLPMSSYGRDFPFKVGIWNRMANAVGGDFYITKKFSATKFLIASFDVSGKNVAAALLTITVASFFSSYEFGEKDLNPKTISSKLDDFLAQVVPMGNFITAALCYVDTKEKIVEIQNCGHTTVYLFVPDKSKKLIKLASLEPTLPPFGMGAVKDDLNMDPTGKSYRCTLSPGMHVNMYSDGFTDMQSEGNIRYEERVKPFFMNLYKKQAEEMENFTKHTVDNWIENAMLPDDITVMDIRF